MSVIQEWGLSAYYVASLPLRQQMLSSRARRGQAPACVLFYHRVADRSPNPWTISRASFREQMEWLQEHTDIVTLFELQQRLKGGNNPRIATHVTFDDGYAENCEFAIPFLLERRIPCTYFVTLDFVCQGKPFPHDQQQGCPLPPNSIAQIQDMARAGIEIGSHTRSHADLGSISDPQVVHHEVVSAAHELADRVGFPIRYFAFPFGLPANITPLALDAARQAGFLGVCSAYGGYNWPGEDSFHIRRFHGDPLFARVRNWLTLDPLRLRTQGL